MAPRGPADSLRRSAVEPEAFAAVFDAYFEVVLRYAVRRTYDADISLDLAAETFAQAYRGRKRFRGTTDAEVLGWLYGIARRQLAGYFRRSKIETKALQRLGIDLPELDAEKRDRIEELAGLAELRAVIRYELQRLSSAQRAALRLRVVDELPYSEVARRLEISEDAARARVARGLKNMAAALDREPDVKEAI